MKSMPNTTAEKAIIKEYLSIKAVFWNLFQESL